LWLNDGCGRAGYGGVHVDDMRGRAKRSMIEYLHQTLSEVFGFTVKVQIVEIGDTCEFVGERYTELAECVLIDQEQYVEGKLGEVVFDGPKRWKTRDADCTSAELHDFRSRAMSLAWVTCRTRPEIQYESSVAATRFNNLHVHDVLRLNKAIRIVKDPRWRYRLRIPKLQKLKGFRVVIAADAGEGELKNNDWTKAQGGRVIGVMNDGMVGDGGAMAIADVRSGKLKRVTHASFDAETVNAIESVDVALGVVELIREWQVSVRPGRAASMHAWLDTNEWPDEHGYVDMELHTDCRDLVDNVEAEVVTKQLTKRRRIDVADLRELRKLGQLRRLLHVDGDYIHPDPLTKYRTLAKRTMGRLVDLLRTSHYDPITK